MKIKFLSIFLLVFGGLTLFGQVAKPSKGTYALTNASIQTVTKGLVQGTLVIQDGKITALGTNAAVPSGAQVIDCKGLTLYPGLIDGGTQLGLVEVESVDSYGVPVGQFDLDCLGVTDLELLLDAEKKATRLVVE
jgi:hypothetical protein